MPRVAGCDPGTSSLDVLVLQDGTVADQARFEPDQLRGDPELPTRWLRDRGTKDFLAARLDDTPGLVNYHNRRQAMQGWCLGLGTWQELTSRLPPVPGPVQPVPDDRKRQEASAFTWARVT